MLRITKLMLISCLLLLQHCAFSAGIVNSPVGFWKTIDDASGRAQSILNIWQTADGSLHGQIVKIWPAPGKTENEVCVACKGARHNKRILGMVIMENVRQNPEHPNQWQGGQILDPTNGKLYLCNLNVFDNGQKLNVRGYIGIPLFGRTQTWLRVAKPQP